MQDSLSTETMYMLLKWLIIITVWLLLAIDLYKDHARIVRIQDSFTVTKLLYVLHKRNIHLFCFFSLLLLALASNDLNLNNKEPQAVEQQEAAAPPPSAASPAAQQAAVPSSALPNNPNMPFGNVTEFNEKNSKQQANIDFLKERYETWLITFYYLQKCSQVASGDLDLITGALKKDLDADQADASVQTNIIQAATGSYQEMYSNIPCDAEHEARSKASYDNSMKRLLPPAEKPTLTPNTVPPSNDTPSPSATTTAPAATPEAAPAR